MIPGNTCFELLSGKKRPAFTHAHYVKSIVESSDILIIFGTCPRRPANWNNLFLEPETTPFNAFQARKDSVVIPSKDSGLGQ